MLLTTQYLDEADRLAHRIVVMDAGKVIAEGTSSELKDRLGGDRLEIEVGKSSSFEQATEIMSNLDPGTAPLVDVAQRRISATREGALTLMVAARRLDEAGIALEDISLHRPSLDDVFLESRPRRYGRGRRAAGAVGGSSSAREKEAA